MTLEKRIELIEQTLRTLQSMREKYKRPKQIDNDIAFNSEILGYLKELQEFKSNSAERPTGKWIIIDDTEKFIAKCSVCGRIEDSRMVKDYPYCHCGARMEDKNKC